MPTADVMGAVASVETEAEVASAARAANAAAGGMRAVFVAPECVASVARPTGGCCLAGVRREPLMERPQARRCPADSEGRRRQRRGDRPAH